MGSRSVAMPWAVVLLLLVIICAISFGLGKVGQNLFGGSTLGHCRILNIANLQDLQTTQTGFVYYDGNTVSCIGSDGNTRWSYLVGVNAGFRATDYGVAAWSRNTITLIDAQTGATTYNGTLDEAVEGAYIGDRYTAILTGKSGESSCTMMLMENGGRQVNRILLDDVLVVDYGFYSNGTLLWVMVCDTNGTVPVCNIQTYKPSREIVGSISDTQQLVYAVSFQSSQVCVVGDTYIKLYDYAGVENTAARRLSYGWYLAAWDHSKNDPLMAFVKDAQYSDGNIQDVRIVRSDIDKVVRMPFACRDLAVSGDTVYGFAADGHMMILPASQGKAESYRLNITVDQVYGVTRDHVAVLGSGDSIYLVNLE